jgi:hypothetical protein
LCDHAHENIVLKIEEAGKAGSCCGFKAMDVLRLNKEEHGKSDIYCG